VDISIEPGKTDVMIEKSNFTSTLIKYFRKEATIEDLRLDCLNDDQLSLVKNIEDEELQKSK
tara:strand:+ start:354 stop:539 length:186 start_codon:yes stop_codon:yes gene_type:complete